MNLKINSLQICVKQPYIKRQSKNNTFLKDWKPFKTKVYWQRQHSLYAVDGLVRLHVGKYKVEENEHHEEKHNLNPARDEAWGLWRWWSLYFKRLHRCWFHMGFVGGRCAVGVGPEIRECEEWEERMQMWSQYKQCRIPTVLMNFLCPFSGLFLDNSEQHRLINNNIIYNRPSFIHQFQLATLKCC